VPLITPSLTHSRTRPASTSLDRLQLMGVMGDRSLGLLVGMAEY
jgi:hypothetical protein